MNLKGFATIALAGMNDVKAYVGPATMVEIESLLNEEIFDIYVISSVHFSYKAGATKSLKVNSGTQIDKDKMSIFKEHLSSLNVLLVPRGVQVDLQSLVAEAAKTLSESRDAPKGSVKKETLALKDNAVKAYMLCLKISKDLYGVLPVGSGGLRVDEELGKKIISLGQALDILYEAALKVAKQLTADGSLLSELEGVEKPDQAEAKAALQAALDSMLVGYHLDRVRKYFGTEGLARLCLAALLQNAGLWGKQKPEGHEERSAHLLDLLAVHGWKGPPGLKDLIVNHTRARHWSDFFVLKVRHNMVLVLADGKSDVSLDQVSYHTSPHSGKDLTHLYPVSVLSGNINHDKDKIKETTTSISCLGDEEAASAIVLGLVEEMGECLVKGMDRNSAIDAMLARIPYDPDLKYESGEDIKNRLPIFSKVIGAMVNAWRLEPLPKGAIVFFDYENVPRAFVEQLGIDCVYVSLGSIKDNPVLTHLIYLVPCKKDGKPPGQKIVTIGQVGARIGIYNDKKMVAGVFSPRTYADIVRSIKNKIRN